MKDVKKIFECAANKGESKIVDRILVRTLPELLKFDRKITPEYIEKVDKLEVPDELYELIKNTAKELTGLECPECLG